MRIVVAPDSYKGSASALHVAQAVRRGIFVDGTNALIEMATASGLMLAAQNKRDPHLTSSYETGELPAPPSS